MSCRGFFVDLIPVLTGGIKSFLLYYDNKDSKHSPVLRIGDGDKADKQELFFLSKN